MSRAGFMVTCRRDSDCRSRCGYHHGTGEPYVCAKRFELYDYVETSEDAVPKFLQLDNAASFDPDPSETALTGEHGICVDAQYSYMQQCPYSVASQVVHGITGCADRWWSLLMCGIDVKRVGPVRSVRTAAAARCPTIARTRAGLHDCLSRYFRRPAGLLA